MTEYLIDTNILIYYLVGALLPEEKPNIDKILQESFNISIITRIELLGWKGHTSEGLVKARELLDCARCIPLTDTLAEKTIEGICSGGMASASPVYQDVCIEEILCQRCSHSARNRANSSSS